MITIAKKIKITAGQAPYTYLWSSSNACLTFSQALGTITGDTIETNFLVADESCTATATLTITSACGNSQAFTVNYTIPCNSLAIQPIVNNNSLVFEVTASSTGCNKADFVWDYDRAVFGFISQVDGTFNSKLSLTLKQDISLPSNTQLSVTATDCKGCEKTALYTYNIQSPKVEPIIVNLYPTKDNTLYTGEATFTVPVDTFYDTLSQKVPTILTVTRTGSLTYKYTAPFNTVNDVTGNINTQPVYTIGSYTIKSKLGVISNTAEIKFIYHKPEVSKSINITSAAFDMPCDIIPSQPFKVDMANYVTVSDGTTIDWTSFMIVAPNPINDFLISIVSEGDKKYLSYSPNLPVVTDVVNFVLKSTDGVISNTGTFTFKACPPVPIATNDAFTIAANSTVTKNILSNDNGNGSQLDPSTVEVTNVQSGLTVSANADGTVTITVDKNASGTRYFNYTVKNTSGTKSNTALVTITVVNAGQNTNVILCD